MYGKFQKKERNTFLFLFLRVFSVFSEKSFLFSPPPWLWWLKHVTDMDCYQGNNVARQKWFLIFYGCQALTSHSPTFSMALTVQHFQWLSQSNIFIGSHSPTISMALIGLGSRNAMNLDVRGDLWQEVRRTHRLPFSPTACTPSKSGKYQSAASHNVHLIATLRPLTCELRNYRRPCGKGTLNDYLYWTNMIHQTTSVSCRKMVIVSFLLEYPYAQETWLARRRPRATLDQEGKSLPLASVSCFPLNPSALSTSRHWYCLLSTLFLFHRLPQTLKAALSIRDAPT
jgi:hypothetical protein